MPLNTPAGGWDGIKKFAETCDKLGYIFAIHDQYRDYYLDASYYDPRHTIINEKGVRPYENAWAGGPQSILCPELAPGYVARNYLEMTNHEFLDKSYRKQRTKFSDGIMITIDLDADSYTINPSIKE